MNLKKGSRICCNNFIDKLYNIKIELILILYKNICMLLKKKI